MKIPDHAADREQIRVAEELYPLTDGILWTAHVDVPEKGAPISLTPKDMELPPEEPKKK